MRARFVVAIVVLFPLVALQGCSGGGVAYAPVSGKVTMDGKPLAKVNVVFVPLAKPGSDVAGDTAGGVTDENGQYTLKTFTAGGTMKEGAQVGKHKVRISLQETRGEGDRSITTEKIPKRYNQDTELTAEVTAGNNQKDFELKSH